MTIQFVTFGMFIIDEFTFADEQGKPTEQMVPPQGRLGFTSRCGPISDLRDTL